MSMTTQTLTGRRKAATILVSLGPELSAQVLRHLNQTDVEDLTLEVFTIGALSEEVTSQVVEEFYHFALAHDCMAVGGADYAREMLVKALGPERAQELLSRLAERGRPRPFDFLARSDPTQLTTFLQEEHPQTIALVLGHLPHNLAATVLKSLPLDLATDVSLRLTAMDRTSPEVVEAVEGALQHRMGGLLTADFTRVGGTEFMAKVLSLAERTMEKAILDGLESRDSEMAAEVRRLLFTFDDLSLLDDRSLQRVLREVEPKDLSLALKIAPEELQERIFRNLSTRAAEMLRDDMSLHGPVRSRQVLDAQQRIVSIVRKLEEQEEIIVERGGQDTYV